jgi:hypothetical protein
MGEPLYGSNEFINSEHRYCLWIDETTVSMAEQIPEIQHRIEGVRQFRVAGGQVASGLVSRPHQFRYTHQAKAHLIIIPRVSSERRIYIPCGLLTKGCIVSDSAQVIYDAEIWHLSVLLSLLHMSWVRAVAGRLEMRLRYSSALCYNNFPLPALTEKNKVDLTRCAEDILLAREAYFPDTVADLYDPEMTPADLREAHERNDEVLERIYIGRRFRNDTDRLEKLFELYTKIVVDKKSTRNGAAAERRHEQV